jgi:hypothetical protein
MNATLHRFSCIKTGRSPVKEALPDVLLMTDEMAVRRSYSAGSALNVIVAVSDGIYRGAWTDQPKMDAAHAARHEHGMSYLRIIACCIGNCGHDNLSCTVCNRVGSSLHGDRSATRRPCTHATCKLSAVSITWFIRTLHSDDRHHACTTKHMPMKGPCVADCSQKMKASPS